ncbi:MAG: hypothetical protein ACRESR_04535 [Gammaproteobacteria bacterium]
MMHQRVLDTIRAGVDAGDDPSLRLLRRAQAAADYELGRGLLAHGRYRQARSRFARVMSQGHKPIRSLVWLACAWFAPASTSVFGALKSPLGRKISPGAMGESTRTRWAKKAS